MTTREDDAREQREGTNTELQESANQLGVPCCSGRIWALSHRALTAERHRWTIVRRCLAQEKAKSVGSLRGH